MARCDGGVPPVLGDQEDCLVASFERVLRNQARGISGALIVADVTILLTIETWWLAWERPVSHLLAYAVVGLGLVLAIMRSSGFRVEEENENCSQYGPLRLTVDFAELVLQSVVAALVVLVVYGVVDASTSPHLVGRMALLQVVPLGFGAALSNRFLAETDDETEEDPQEQSLPENVAVFAVGALFFALPLGASIEMRVLTAGASWPHLAAVVLLSLLSAYLILYELEFRGQSRRTVDREWALPVHAGHVFLVYVVGLVVAAVLLWGSGYLSYSLSVNVQKIIVLTFPTTVGGAAARVIL